MKHLVQYNTLKKAIKSCNKAWLACLFILFGLLISLVCYTVLFADESFWFITHLSKIFKST